MVRKDADTDTDAANIYDCEYLGVNVSCYHLIILDGIFPIKTLLEKKTVQVQVGECQPWTFDSQIYSNSSWLGISGMNCYFDNFISKFIFWNCSKLTFRIIKKCQEPIYHKMAVNCVA